MKIIADLHIHSYFSRATSKKLNLEHLSKWAQLKGVNVVGTGDIAHPGWLQEMKEKLEPAEDGLFKLKDEIAASIQPEVFKACRAPVRFLLGGEISNIYKRHDQVRKIHNVVFMPSFDALEKFQARLDKIGNIRSDGRPILGLDSRDLLEIVLETDPQGYLIPAHIWTPWFAMLGSMSGFDSVEECFGDLTKHIFALETGLSSDPPMNWRLSILDKYTLVSNSDAHSPQKLAREANVFDTELSYPAIFNALKTGDPNQFKGTIEFFPEEGKYHYDGHRKCKVRWEPKETIQNQGICTKCGKKVTVGVMHRVEKLADREPGEKGEKTHPFKSLAPLPELLAEIHGVGVNSKRVQTAFEFMLKKMGSELSILQEAPLEEITKCSNEMVAEGIKRMREGSINIAAGYDGEFGVIRLFDENERKQYSTQLSMFIEKVKEQVKRKTEHTSPGSTDKTAPIKPNKLNSEDMGSPTVSEQNMAPATEVTVDGALQKLNISQRQAVEEITKPLIITAGPGTGKTRILTDKIAFLIEKKGIQPEIILAVTFTNQAASEMRHRLGNYFSAHQTSSLTICTFHALAAAILREHSEKVGFKKGFSICTEEEKIQLLIEIEPDISKREATQIAEAIAIAKNHLISEDDAKALETATGFANLQSVYKNYQKKLHNAGLLDFEDLLCFSIDLLNNDFELVRKYSRQFQWLFVDEYQDINEAQYRLIQLLSSEARHLTVIGDPDQSIYGFRGASAKYFHRFSHDFPEAHPIQLNQNYRSTQTILKASSQLLASETQARQMPLLSNIVGKAKLTIHRAATDKAEAEFIVHTTESLVGGTSYFSIDSGRVKDENAKPLISFGDIAVLFRTKALLPSMQEAFSRSGIPYQTIGETPFFKQKNVRCLIDYLSFINTNTDSLRLKSILLNSTSGIGEISINKLSIYAADNCLSLWDALQSIKNVAGLNAQQIAGGKNITQALTTIEQMAKTESVAHLVAAIVKLPIAASSLNDVENNNLLNRLTLAAKPHGNNLNSFLHEIAMQSDIDDFDRRADRVTLMSLHASKGLEFSTVFIAGCEEKLIPYQDTRRGTDIDEERRLLYVGMTRARNKLYLSSAGMRTIWGRTENTKPSRFLNKIENTLKEISQTRLLTKKKNQQPNPQIDLF